MIDLFRAFVSAHLELIFGSLILMLTLTLAILFIISLASDLGEGAARHE